MAAADSVSVFSEGTFEEQIQELVNYITRSHQDVSRAEILHSFRDLLKREHGQKPLEEDEMRRKEIFSRVLAQVRGLGDGSDREIEGFFNLMFAHLLSLYASDSLGTTQHLVPLLEIIASAPPERQSVKYRLLSNLFNATPRTSPLRYTVYSTLLSTALTNDELETLQLTQTDVEKWLSEWDISGAEKSAFLKSLALAHKKSGLSHDAYEYFNLCLQSLPPTSPEARETAIDLIATALRLPSILDFDPLMKLDAVVALKDHNLFSLLKVYLNDGLPEFIAWADSHSDTFEKYDLERSQLEWKIRLLTLASLAANYIGQDLPYSKVTEALRIDSSDVEKWAIDGIRAGLVWAKLTQTSQSLRIIRVKVRKCEREEWVRLEKRLLSLKAGLNGVLEVLGDAKRLAVPEELQIIA